MIPLSKLEYKMPDRLTRYVEESAKKEAKMMAARGMLPIPPNDLVLVLFSLTRGDDEEIQLVATKTLAKMPENILKTICEDKDSHPLILDFLARNLPPDSPLQSTLALNWTTHDETVVVQADYPNKNLILIIAENQKRILRCPGIVDALADNLLMGLAQMERIFKLVEMETKKSEKLEPKTEVEEVAPPKETEHPEATPVDEDDDDEVATVTDDDDDLDTVTIDDEGVSAWATMNVADEFMEDVDPEEAEADDFDDSNISKVWGSLKISQKIKASLMGGSAARRLGLKDTNKVVATAAIKSPKITPKEVETASNSRGVCDDVIRIIAANKDWTRSYQIKMNLVQNPKTPMPDAMRFLNFLRDKDLRDISKSKNVPSNVAQQAKRLLKRKEDKKKPGAKH